MIREHGPLGRRLKVRSGISGTGPIKPSVLGATECPNGHATIEISTSIRSGTLALAVLLHEMIHASLPRFTNEHGREFRVLARKVGFTSPYRQIHTSWRLYIKLAALRRKLGPFPQGSTE